MTLLVKKTMIEINREGAGVRAVPQEEVAVFLEHPPQSLDRSCEIACSARADLSRLIAHHQSNVFTIRC